MAYKRKYRSYGGSFRKRRRYSRAPRRTRFRRRSRYPTRRYKSRKGGRRMQRTYYRINGRNAKNMAPLCWRTHHATQKRTPQLMKNVMKSIGQVHFHRILAEGNTSLTTNNNPLFYRFMPSLDTSSVYSWYCVHPSAATATWSSVSANGWGQTNYTIDTFPTGYKRMLWAHTYM